MEERAGAREHARRVRRALRAAGILALAAPLAAARAADETALQLGPLSPPRIEDPRPFLRAPEVSNLERTGRVVFVLGALCDVYTTKVAFDHGLSEQNPMLRPFAKGRGGLAVIYLSKIVGWSILTRVPEDSPNASRHRAYLLLGGGTLQLGIALANHRAIEEARARSRAGVVP